MKLFELPKGWVWTRLEECAEIILGQSPPSSTYNENENGLPFYQGKLEFGDIFPTPRKWCTAPKKIAEKRDVLISVRAPVGPTNLCLEKSCIGRGLAAVRGLNGIESFFILYLLRAFEDEIAGKGTGTTFNAITGGQLKEFAVPLPPLPEQHRIVTKVEELFTRLDAGVGALTKAKAQLKRYRQSVLKSACEGRLVPTEAELARAEGRDYEPADVLLARIGKERREKWGAEKKRKGKKSAKYKEPAAPDVSGLPELPEGWCWANVDSFTVFGPQNGLYLPKSAYGVGVSIIRIDDFQDNSSRSACELHQVNADQNDIQKYSLMKNDLVINRVNSPTHLGKCLVVAERNLPSIFESNMMRLRLSASVNPFFVGFYLRSVSGKKRLISNAKWAVNQASINQKDVVSTPVPLPPFPEQHRIVAEIERRLSVADEIEKTIDQRLKQAERLRQSILKKAFEGKLVPQDPNDEPAEKMIGRIKQEKTKIKVRK